MIVIIWKHTKISKLHIIIVKSDAPETIKYEHISMKNYMIIVVSSENVANNRR